MGRHLLNHNKNHTAQLPYSTVEENVAPGGLTPQSCSILDCGERDGCHSPARVCFLREEKDLRNSLETNCVLMDVLSLDKGRDSRSSCAWASGIHITEKPIRLADLSLLSDSVKAA